MKKVLVVIDMQNDFIDGSLGTKEAEKIVGPMVGLINDFDGKIFYTMDTHYEYYLDTLEGKKLPVKHCMVGTPGWQINEKVKEALRKKNAVPVTKPTFGSFKLLEEIDKICKQEESKELDITLAGLCTDICVASNALLLRAKYPNTTIRIVSSCCAGVTPESHAAALTTMQMCQMDII